MKIDDGTGSGYQAKVSQQNRLSVNAVNVEEITHISSIDGSSYSIHIERTLVAANTLEDLCHFTYTGDNKLQIDSIILSREDVALASSGQAVVEVLTGVTYTSGGDAVIPTNLNIGSSKFLSSDVYSGTTTIVSDKASEVEVIDIAFSEPHKIEYKGSLILNKNDSIALVCKSLNIGDTVHCELTVYEVTEDI